jgi:hypothetical protein
MKSAKEKIFTFLKTDTTLINSLGSNKPFNNLGGVSAKTNSIIPRGMANASLNTPFITIGASSSSRQSDWVYDEIFDIVVYDDTKRTYVTIDTIIDRLRVILDKQTLDFDNQTNFKTYMVGIGQDLTEQELNLNFKEISFRFFII